MRGHMSISKQTIQSFIIGNEDAIGKVYDEYKNLMYFVIASYISLPEDCEDVLSDAFIKAINHRNDLKNPDSLKTYLTTIARNCALDFLKKSRETPAGEIIEEMNNPNAIVQESPNTLSKSEETSS